MITRIRPSWWLPCLEFCWGLLTLALYKVTDPKQIYALRAFARFVSCHTRLQLTGADWLLRSFGISRSSHAFHVLGTSLTSTMTEPNLISVYSTGNRFPDRILPLLSIYWKYGEPGHITPRADSYDIACRCPPSRYL